MNRFARLNPLFYLAAELAVIKVPLFNSSTTYKAVSNRFARCFAAGPFGTSRQVRYLLLVVVIITISY